MDINEKKKNPWAICGANIKNQKSAKFERCVLKVKKKTGYHESSNPVDQIAEMITDDPNLILECEPNATWDLGNQQVHGVAFRDEPWDQAMHDIADTWSAGYKIMVFEDGLLMANDPSLMELGPEQGAQVFFPKSVNEALTLARQHWWNDTSEEAPPSDQFPRMESIEAIMDTITEDMSAVGMMAPAQQKSPEELEAEMDALLASFGPEAPVKPEVEPEVEPGVVPDAPEPTEPDPFNPTQPAIDPHPKACEY